MTTPFRQHSPRLCAGFRSSQIAGRVLYYEGEQRPHGQVKLTVSNICAVEEGAEADDAADDSSHCVRGEALLASMVEGLRLLDAEGFFGTFFGTEREREKVTLFVSISDSDEAAEVETSSARRLNPPKVAAVFVKRCD